VITLIDTPFIKLSYMSWWLLIRDVVILVTFIRLGWVLVMHLFEGDLYTGPITKAAEEDIERMHRNFAEQDLLNTIRHKDRLLDELRREKAESVSRMYHMPPQPLSKESVKASRRCKQCGGPFGIGQVCQYCGQP
jgi:hypothetical protein